MCAPHRQGSSVKLDGRQVKENPQREGLIASIFLKLGGQVGEARRFSWPLLSRNKNVTSSAMRINYSGLR